MRYLLVSALAWCFLPYSLLGQTLTSSNLPIVIIDTHGSGIFDEPKVSGDMGIIDNGPGQRNNITDPYNNYNGKIGIEYRGSSSQMFPKKPYSVELQGAAGGGVSASILGMPPEEDWAFIATYNDKSLIRDALAYKLARDLGRYAPRTRFVELIINGSYEGIYMVAEKIKRDKNRVDISKLEPTEISGDDLTGGYIIKIDKSTGNSGFGFVSDFAPPSRAGSQSIYFQYDYPAYNVIVPQQKQYIQTFIRNFENTLASITFKDPVNGYVKYIDEDSFIDYLIINELSKNVDGYRLSTFMYKDKDSNGGKLVMGPVWDYNLAFGNANYCSGAPVDGWMYDFNSVCGGDGWLIPFWWKRLLEDFRFSQKLGTRWKDLRDNKLSNSTISNYIDSITTVLKSEATARNFEKWPVLGQWVWPNEFVGPTYASEVNWLKGWISNRLMWLDYNMPLPIISGNEPEAESDVFSVRSYPNPFKSNFKVEYSVQKPGTVKLELYDVLGQRRSLLTQSHTTSGNYEAVFEKLNIPNGTYILKVTSSITKGVTVRSVVKAD